MTGSIPKKDLIGKPGLGMLLLGAGREASITAPVSEEIERKEHSGSNQCDMAKFYHKSMPIVIQLRFESEDWLGVLKASS